MSQKTIVMVNHDIDLALRYSDRMTVMKNGKLLHCGDAAEILASEALEEAFNVEICPFPAEHRSAFTIFPR